MNILVAFNDGYTLPTKIMLKSVIANNNEGINIFCLYDQLSKESIESIQQLSDNNKVLVSLVHVDKELFKYAPVHHHFSKESYFRLFAHRFIDEKVDRILWLDGDVIVNDSLHDFYTQDFEEKLFVAVEDMVLGKNEKKHTTLQIPIDIPYINSGVLLMNLTEMRRKLDDKRIYEYIKTHQDMLEWVDQDVYNGLLYNDFKVINSDYWYNYFSWRIDSNNKESVYRNVKVIHYCGTKKPWKTGFADYGFDIYWKYGLQNSNEFLGLYRKVHSSYILFAPLKRIKLFLESKMNIPHEIELKP